MTASLTDSTHELRIQEIGSELFKGLKTKKQKTPGAWWNSKLIEHSMKDEALKVQLFRFVDVLPALRDSSQVARHMEEYFNTPGHSFPGIFSWGASLAGMNRFTAALSAMAVKKSVEEMAHTFICGATNAEAIKKVAEFRKKNLTATLDLLGEAVVSEIEAESYTAKYLSLLDDIDAAARKWPDIPLLDSAASGPLPKINVSLKLTSLYSQIDAMDPIGSEAGLRPRLEKILDRAIAASAFVNVDMEDYHVKDLTLRVFKDVLALPKYRDYRYFGIVIQAYLKDSQKDLRELGAWAKRRGVPVTVRLVKGAYWDYETIRARQHGWPVPVFERKPATDANFEACARILLENYPHLQPALASHNVRSLAAGLAQAEALQLPRNAVEIQGLYGMADPLKETLAEQGYRVRVYMPFGELLPGMAYLVRRLLENTANDSFLRQGMVEGVSEAKLLLAPFAATAETPPPQVGFENEPEAALFSPKENAAFAAALLDVRTKFGRTYPLVINGKEEKGGAGEIVSLNPSQKRQVIGSVASANIEQANRAIAAARGAFPAWRDTPISARAAILRKAAALMRTRKYELCAWEVYEAAKPWREADGDVAEAIDFLEYYATEAERTLVTRRHSPVPGETNENLYQPRGVAAVLAPWNFPLAILTGMASAALVTGNTVILKPAEQTSVIGAKLMEILKEAGVPAGVVNFLPGDGATVGAHLVTHPQVNLIAFTGSKDVGLWINAEAAKTREGQQGVKRVICEMGGKNAIVVDEDADLDEAVLGTVQSAFGFAGQKCSAASRAIVVGSAYEPFLKRLVEATRSIRIAEADDPGCRVPPVIDDEARTRILQMIERGKKEAAIALEMDAGILKEQGSFVGPVLFSEVPPTASIAQEEIFGPVLCVMRASSFEQAVQIALDVPFALTGGLYSRSPANVAKARETFRVGNLYINRNITGAKVDRHPFGGFKFSGIGSKAGGPDYLLQFVEPRTITENTLRRGFAPQED